MPKSSPSLPENLVRAGGFAWLTAGTTFMRVPGNVARRNRSESRLNRFASVCDRRALEHTPAQALPISTPTAKTSAPAKDDLEGGAPERHRRSPTSRVYIDPQATFVQIAIH